MSFGWIAEYGKVYGYFGLVKFIIDGKKDGYHCFLRLNGNYQLNESVNTLHNAKIEIVKNTISKLQETLNALEVELIELEKEEAKSIE